MLQAAAWISTRLRTFSWTAHPHPTHGDVPNAVGFELM